MFLLIIICLLLGILLGIYYYKQAHVLNKNLKHFPCPPELPILGHALDFFSGKGSLDVLMDYTKNYGDIVRVKTGPKRQLLLVSNYNLIAFLLTNAKISKKSVDYDYFYRWLGTGLITADGGKWKHHRRIITPSFHFNILENFIPVFESNGRILVKQFEKNLDTIYVNIYPLVNLCAMDIISESAMGISVKAQENGESEYVKSVKLMLDIIIERVFSPHKMFEWIYRFTEDYRREKKAIEILHSFTRSVIKRRQETLQSEDTEEKAFNSDNGKKKAFLDLLLDANRNEQNLTLEEIREEVDTFMFAGHDTTASAISFALFCLANHPEEQAQVFMEQQQIFGDDFERPLSMQDLKSMKYLELVIKETLRLYSPAPFFSRELDRDVPFQGTTLPRGLTITIFMHALHRNPEYFPEPEKFLPNRFKTVDGKLPFAYLPFGAGPRNCIGQKFAMNEMKSIVSLIIRNFELLPSIPTHELKLASQIILISTNGVCIRFKRR